MRGTRREHGSVALPELTALESTTALFTGVTRIRGLVAGPDRWRVDELTPVGERDTYRLGSREFVWDFGFDQLTELAGQAALRLPRAGDPLRRPSSPAACSPWLRTTLSLRCHLDGSPLGQPPGCG